MPFWPTSPLDLASGGFAPPGTLLILAYLDPGMGSYVFQILLASLFGGMFALKQGWSEIKDWFLSRSGGRSGRSDAPTDRRGIGIRPRNITRPRIDVQSPAEIP